jgi:hypothetical protein
MSNDIDKLFQTLEAYRGKDYGSMTEYRITKVRLDYIKHAIKNLIAQETNKAVIAELEFEQRYFNKFPFQEFIDKYVSDRIKALKAKEQA